MTAQQARQKIYKYCAYQERCHQEVEEKLRSFYLPDDQIEEIISHLIQEGFLNEERYARFFVAGKFRLKNWGRLKIRHELEQKNVSRHCIKAGLNEIIEEDYQQCIQKLLSKKAEQLDEVNIFVLRDKLATSVIAKGFEPELVWTLTKKMFPDKR